MSRKVFVVILTSMLISALRYVANVNAINFTDASEETSFPRKVLKSQYIDKSMLIKEIIDDTHKLIIINKPVHSGKTLHLDMLATFFQHPEYRQMFVGGEFKGTVDGKNVTATLEPLQIARYEDAMKYQGCHPVLRIKHHVLDTVINGEMMILTQLRQDIRQRGYLQSWLDSNFTLKSRFEKYKRYCSFKADNNISYEEVVDGLRFVSEVLCKYHGNKVYVLVDEYEMPFFMVKRQDTFERVKKTVLMLREMYCRAFNNNPYVEKGVMTGLLRLSDVYEEVFSHVENVLESTVLDEKFSEFYYIGKSEVQNLTSKGCPNQPNDEEHSLERWCCGYSFRGYLCNPSAVRDYMYRDRFLYSNDTGDCFIEEREFANYYPHMFYPHSELNFTRWRNVRRDCRRLYMDEIILKSIVPITSKNVFNDESVVPSVLLQYGYLNPITKADGDRWRVNILNHDSKLWLYLKIEKWIRKTFCVHLVFSLYEYVKFLLAGEFYKFQDHWFSHTPLVEPCVETYNFLMIAVWDPIHILRERRDGQIHYMTYFALHNDTETVTVIVLPKPIAEVNDTAVIVAYRFAKDEGSLQSEAEECARQIDIGVFNDKMQKYKYIREVKKIGMAFYKNNVTVQSIEEIIQRNTCI